MSYVASLPSGIKRCRVVMIASAFVLSSHFGASPSRGVAAEKVDWLRAVAESPVRGGLCVVLGSLDDRAALKAVEPTAERGPFLVHLLVPPKSAADVPATRERLRREGVYGSVSLETWSESTLPYVDDLVSLLVVVDPMQVEQDELLRVVRPGGELLVRDGDHWRRTIKPRPAGMDEWSQWRHGADRNAVSADRLVDVPQRVQWLFSSHLVLEGADMVTNNGRMFIQDRDQLLARDAFNGLPLWQVALYPHKKLGLEKPPALMMARDDRVYALLADGRFHALDAATGKRVTEFAGAGLPQVSLLTDGGTLVMADEEQITAFDARTGELLWRESANIPHTLTAGDGLIYYLEGNDKRGSGSGDVTARREKSGDLAWRKNYEWARRSDLASFGMGHLVFEVRRPTGWRELWKDNPQREKEDKFQLVVVDAKTGDEKKKLYGVASSARHGEFCTAFWHQGKLLTEARTSAGLGIAKYDPSDLAKPLDVFQANFAGDRGWGHCYPPVLTERFYINGQMHFTDLEKQRQTANPITRGACHILRAGYVPANGMIYTFPKHCVCFPMLNGNACLAPASSSEPPETHPRDKGSAFDSTGTARATPATAATSAARSSNTDWPTFRHDEFRTGGTSATLPEKLDTTWELALGEAKPKLRAAQEWSQNPWIPGPLSAPVSVGGTVYVSECHSHRLVAVDGKTGRVRWDFIAGGRFDGPPTIHQNLALIGCRDGWVYAVRTTDGALAWRTRIAPTNRRISSYGQLESAWPCAASVLVTDGLAYVSAGLHPNSDGGLRVACLRPETGELVWVKRLNDMGMESPWPAPHDPRPTDKPSYVSDPWRTIRPQEYRHFDLPVRDGDKLAVSRTLFDLRTGADELRKTSGYYEVPESAALLPRTAWRFTDVQTKSPLAVAYGDTVYSTSPRKGALFRADFATGERFDTDWVNVPHEQFKAGISHAASKIYHRGFRWSVPTGNESNSYPRALAATRDRLIYAYPSGQLSLYSTTDGRELQRLKLEPLAWDGVAITQGRLVVTTADGKLICFGS